MSRNVFIVRRDDGSIAPWRAHDAEEIATYAIGKPIKAVLSLPRSPDENRFYWALIGLVAKGKGLDKDSLHTEILLRTRRFKSLVLQTPGQASNHQAIVEALTEPLHEALRDRNMFEGYPLRDRAEVVRSILNEIGGALGAASRAEAIPLSISEMSHPEFHAYVKDAIEFIFSDLLEGVRRRDIIQQVEQMTGNKYSDFDSPPSPEQSDGDTGGGRDVVAPSSATADHPPATNIYERFSEALFEVTRGGPMALLARRKQFGKNNAWRPADEREQSMINRIYAWHTDRIIGKMSGDDLRQAVHEWLRDEGFKGDAPP